MFSPQKMDRHAKLSSEMAEKLGIDLDEAMMRGDVMPEDLRNVVLRCAGCREAGECKTWLGDHPNGAAIAPSYCRNKELLAALTP